MPAAAAAAPSSVATTSRPAAGRAMRNVRRRGAGREPSRRGRGRLCAHAPRSERHDAVGHRHERRSVGHDEDGPTLGEAPDRRQDVGLGRAVETGRRLVEEEQRSVAEEGPGQRDPLALAGGEASAPLAEHGANALRQPSDHVAEPRVLDRLLQRGVVGVVSAEPDVVGDGRGEEVGTLGHPGHVGAPRVRVEVVADRCRRCGPSLAAARRSPSTTESRVDFPQPLGPVMATISPGSTTNDAPSRAGAGRPG